MEFGGAYYEVNNGRKWRPHILTRIFAMLIFSSFIYYSAYSYFEEKDEPRQKMCDNLSMKMKTGKLKPISIFAAVFDLEKRFVCVDSRGNQINAHDYGFDYPGSTTEGTTNL